MAFAPDMSGVCNVGGTRWINSNPRKVASVKITMLIMGQAEPET
jgi:hypothetical protein